MAVPTYTTDLVTFNLCENSGTFGEFVNMEDGGAPDETDQDDVIQGEYLCSAQCSLKVGELQSIYADFGSGVTIPTDGAILMWNKFDAGGILTSYATGGVRAVIGATATNWDAWKAGGSDRTPNPAGGWWNYALNPLVRTYDYRNGAGTGTTYQFAGMAISLTTDGPSKGQPFKIDGFRYGRCSIIFEFGSSGDGYATFADAAAKNDNNEVTNGWNRWGLFSAYGGGYLWKGRMQLGTTTNALEMVDSDIFILIDDTINCTPNFNTLEVNNASTIITWTNVIFKSLSTQSPGRLVMNHDADLNLNACQFFDMSAFTFGGTKSEFLNCVWSGCDLITVAGGKLNGSSVLSSSVAVSASAINWNVAVNPDGYLDDLTISEGTNLHHAIDFGTTSPLTMTINNLDVGSDFAATHSEPNSTFHVSRTTGTVTISCVGCTGNMTYDSEGATVVIVSDPVPVKVTVTTTTGVPVSGALVYIAAKDDTGPFPFEEVVTSITNVGTLATVDHTGHGMASNDFVHIYGGDQPGNEGVFQIDVNTVDEYEYTMLTSPSSPTGTITSTFIALYGPTDSLGVKNTSRVYSIDQPITGWARKSTTSPYYQQGPISGYVDSADGLLATSVLVLDE